MTNLRRNRITTWSGGVPGQVTSYVTEERVRYAPSGGRYRMRHVKVSLPDSSVWQRRGSNAMDAIKIRRKVGPTTDEGQGPKALRDLLKL
ncbi:hypothetical protein ACFWY6_17365 [Streptomyces sp. NPDC059037]|uniref:hypothetical protein n=1 Tax=Streptomyces sp. NPDC059037 TaxID=3346710 RepID=UPI0036852CA4